MVAYFKNKNNDFMKIKYIIDNVNEIDNKINNFKSEYNKENIDFHITIENDNIILIELCELCNQQPIFYIIPLMSCERCQNYNNNNINIMQYL